MVIKQSLLYLIFCIFISNLNAQKDVGANLSSPSKKNESGLKIVTKLERNDGAGKAIIIQRHRNDSTTDRMVKNYIQSSKYSLKKLKTTSASGCSNLDLEDGDFTNWTGQLGVNNGYPASSWVNGMDTTRQNIVTNGIDPYGAFPMLAPNGGNFSIKLGNDNTNYEAEQLIYSFIVQPQDTNFLYKYAVVLQDPAHSYYEQPYFEFKMLDQNDSIIPCSNMIYVASGSIPGFISNGDVRYKPWTTTGVNLASYVGQEVTIIVTTADCSQGAHFGYAYLDFICSSSPTLFCINDTSATLSVFDVGPGMIYNWSTGQTGPIVSFNPQLYNGNSINCYIESATSVGLCGYWYTFPIQVFNYSLSISDSSMTVNEPGLLYQWIDCNNGNEIIPNEINQSFTTTINGNFAVIVSNGICSDTTECAHLNKIAISSINTPGISIFPNPINDKLIIETNRGKSVLNFEILNSMGQVVYKGILTETTIVNTLDFARGVYLINCFDGNSFFSKKIIKY